MFKMYFNQAVNIVNLNVTKGQKMAGTLDVFCAQFALSLILEILRLYSHKVQILVYIVNLNKFRH